MTSEGQAVHRSLLVPMFLVAVLASSPTATLSAREDPPEPRPMQMQQLGGSELPQYFVVRSFFAYIGSLSESSPDRLEHVLREKFAVSPDSRAAATLLAEVSQIAATLHHAGFGPQDFATREAFEQDQIDRALQRADQIGGSFGRFLREVRAEGRSVTRYEDILRHNFGRDVVLHYTDPEDRAFFAALDRRFRQAVLRELGPLNRTLE